MKLGEAFVGLELSDDLRESFRTIGEKALAGYEPKIGESAKELLESMAPVTNPSTRFGDLMRYDDVALGARIADFDSFDIPAPPTSDQQEALIGHVKALTAAVDGLVALERENELRRQEEAQADRQAAAKQFRITTVLVLVSIAVSVLIAVL